MNDSNIPRYKASMPCQTQFITNNDACGDNIFTQVKREGNVAIYRREAELNSRNPQFEVVVLNIVKAGTVFAKGAKPIENDYESYPGARAWGKTGWTLVDLGSAEAKMKAVITGVVETVDPVEDTTESKSTVVTPKATRKTTKAVNVEGIKIPAGEFFRQDLAELNGMPIPVNAVSYGAIVKLLASGKIKKVREQGGGKGKPKTVYIAV